MKRTGCGKRGVSVLPAATDEERMERRRITLRAASRKYREKHRAELRAKSAEYRTNNLAKFAASMRAYRKRNRERFARYEAKRIRTAAAKKKFNAYRRAWAKANREREREYATRRGAKKLNRLPRGAIQRAGNLQGWLCVCGANLRASGYHIDHVVPLAKGGAHSEENIQLLCGPCNLKKGTKDNDVFIATLGRSHCVRGLWQPSPSRQ